MTETKAKKSPAPKPARYDRARLRVIPNVTIPREKIIALGHWLDARRDKLKKFKPDKEKMLHGHFWEYEKLDLEWTESSLVKQAVFAELETTAMALGLDGSYDGAMMMTAKMFQHDGYQWWHRPDPSAWLGFRIFLHANPKMFNGGEVEFTDGTLVQPIGGSMMLYDPKQTQRTKLVECWTPNAMDGRWTIEGMVYPAIDS